MLLVFFALKCGETDKMSLNLGFDVRSLITQQGKRNNMINLTIFRFISVAKNVKLDLKVVLRRPVQHHQQLHFYQFVLRLRLMMIVIY